MGVSEILKKRFLSHFKLVLLYSFSGISVLHIYLHIAIVLSVKKGIVTTKSAVETLKWETFAYA